MAALRIHNSLSQADTALAVRIAVAVKTAVAISFYGYWFSRSRA